MSSTRKRELGAGDGPFGQNGMAEAEQLGRPPDGIGGRYVWRPGHWAAPPRVGWVWVPHRWEPGPGGWHMRPGHWAMR